MKISLEQIVGGNTLPPLYGVAWTDWVSDYVVCYPIPFNKIAGAIRNAWHWLKFSVAPSIVDRQLQYILNAANGRERKIGYDRGLQDGARFVTSMDRDRRDTK